MESRFKCNTFDDIREHLIWRSIAQTFPWCFIIGPIDFLDGAVVELVELGAPGQEASKPADGILDAALLPRGADITEESSHRQLIMQGILGAAIDGQRTP